MREVIEFLIVLADALETAQPKTTTGFIEMTPELAKVLAEKAREMAGKLAQQ